MNLENIKTNIKQCGTEIETLFPDEEIDIYIAGGSALILNGMFNRITRDIDLLKCTNPYLRGIQEIFQKYDMNFDVSAFFDNFPNGFAQRATCISSTGSTKFYCLSIEDIVISKLCTTRYEQDMADIESDFILLRINWQLLDILAKSMKDSMISTLAYERFYGEYLSYVQKHKKGFSYDDV